MTIATDKPQTLAPAACLLLGGIVGGLVGLHAGATGNDLALSNAQQQASEATEQYQDCRTFVESRNAKIDQFYRAMRGQNEPD